jgi:hypothetical protein
MRKMMRRYARWRTTDIVMTRKKNDVAETSTVPQQATDDDELLDL